jgi:hypothetical protein
LSGDWHDKNLSNENEQRMLKILSGHFLWNVLLDANEERCEHKFSISPNYCCDLIHFWWLSWLLVSWLIIFRWILFLDFLNSMFSSFLSDFYFFFWFIFG